nr:protein-L-isoaspartate O-methyltransferase [Gemmatimonadota bacterium]NIR78367.1 protein-L-isoaspartate O-methyltransferase [Gemmatimonadota bacterium]NIT86960.1 protein-L-isoaspartate O-methyltransferase [Gemmatimonadota bacterium]NIU30807.1 protein-L-isoaspartate O-methyltransferase [Gemmatimonadota bacterium]NIU35587.1 protein-L-isoaspartate O-methyltransferase [Gemmatimonadota bacterium]
SVERLDDLADEARRTLERLGYDNVRIRVGDGTRGWPEEAPFDGIVITAAAPDVPPSLQRQLSEDGGRLVAPVGSRTMQDLVRMVREGEEFRSEVLMGCRFVPLLGEEGW